MGTELESGEPRGVVCIDDGVRNSKIVFAAIPTLKRGANEHCAYGAGP